MSDDVLEILYVEDDEDDYVLIRDFLADIPSPRHRLHWAKDHEEGLAALNRSHFNACLLDYYLGEHNALWFLNHVAQNDRPVPVILLTTATDRKIDVEAMQAGAFDFLVKSEIQPAVLERSIRYAIEIKRSEKALRESERQLRLLSARLLIAHEEERKRIAGGLHDSIGSSLTAIKLSLGSLRRQCSPPVAEDLENLIGMAERTLEEMRQIMNALRPPMLDDLGLKATINWFCREYQAIYPDISVKINFHLDEKPCCLKR